MKRRLFLRILSFWLIFCWRDKSGSNARIVFPEDGDHNSLDSRHEDYEKHCLLRGSKRGRCVEASLCSTLKQLLTMKEMPTICHWKQKEPLICCPPPLSKSQLQPEPAWAPIKPPVDPMPVKRGEKNNGDANGKPVNIVGCGTRIPIPYMVPFMSRDRVVTRPRRSNLPGEWPWMAAVFIRITSPDEGHTEPHIYRCGGVVISERYILSAAHCFVNSNAEEYLIKVGSISLETEEEENQYSVEQILWHSQFKLRYHYNDIALLKVNRPIRFSDKVRPICLPFTPVLYIGCPVFVTGFGDTEYGGRRSDELLVAKVYVNSSQECNRTYSTLMSPALPSGINKRLICAGSSDGTMDACQNDSGSPLVVWKPKTRRWFLVGLVAFGHQCAHPSYPGVYTRIGYFRKWIWKHSDLATSPGPPLLMNRTVWAGAEDEVNLP